MQTNGINYVRHVYSLLKGSKNKGCYHLIKNNIKNTLLPEAIKIEVNRDLKKTGLIEKWLILIPSESTNLHKKRIGIARTGLNNIYEGSVADLNNNSTKGENLIFFEFSNNDELLIIDFFKNFNTQNPFAFKFLLENHEFLLQKKAS